MTLRMTAGTFILGLLLVFGAIVGLVLALSDGETDSALEKCFQRVELGTSTTIDDRSEAEAVQSTLEEYFQRIEPLISTIDDRSEAQIVASPDEVLCSWANVLSETADDLDAIDPPREVADAHRELADAIDEGAAAMAELADQHPNVQSLDEAARLKDENEDLAAADLRAREACAELLEFARDNGVGIDLELC